MRILQTTIVLLALAVAACGSKSTAAGGTTATTGTSATTGDAASAALATKLGISPAVVSAAVSAAKAALGGNAAATPEQKGAAAQAGVDKATVQAEAEGKPLSDDQKKGLFEGLQGLL